MARPVASEFNLLSGGSELQQYAQPATALLLMALVLAALILLAAGVRDASEERLDEPPVQQERIISLKFNSFSGGLRSASPKPTIPGRPPLPCSPLSHVSRFQVKRALLTYGRQ